MKKVIREGEGYDSYTDTGKMEFSVGCVVGDAGSLAGFAPNDLEFKAGDGEVCDAMECAVTEKKKGEKAMLTGTLPAQAQEEDLFKTKDVAFAKDKTMMKQVIRESEGHDSPKDSTPAVLEQHVDPIQEPPEFPFSDSPQKTSLPHKLQTHPPLCSSR